MFGQAWKAKRSPMDKCQPQYKNQPASEDLPRSNEAPNLKICQMSGNQLILPRDVRHLFLQCPLFGPDGRSFLQEFDSQWGTPAAATPERGSTGQPGTPSPSPQNVCSEMKVESDFNWEGSFTNEPKTMEEIKSKFGGDVTEMVGPDPNITLLLAPGPILYAVAKEAVTLQGNTPIIAHGAGVWLLGDKASAFKTSNPNRGIPCIWNADDVWVVIEEGFCLKFWICVVLTVLLLLLLLLLLWLLFVVCCCCRLPFIQDF